MCMILGCTGALDVNVLQGTASYQSNHQLLVGTVRTRRACWFKSDHSTSVSLSINTK